MPKIKILSLEEIVAPEVIGLVSPARRAADRLLGAGMNLDTLELDLNDIILNPPTEHRNPLVGKTRKQAALFPERVQNFAGEIEQVNPGLLYELLDSARKNRKAKKVHWLLNRSFTETYQAFRGLPNVLNAYGEFVRFGIRQKRWPVTCQDHFAIILMHHVRLATGKSYFPEVEILLEALFKVRNLRSPYTQSRLRDLYRRTRLRLRPLYLSLKT